MAREAFEVPPAQGALITEPISRYDLQHKSSQSVDSNNNISELIFVADKNGVNHGGWIFMFRLQPMGSMTMLLATIPWLVLKIF